MALKGIPTQSPNRIVDQVNNLKKHTAKNRNDQKPKENNSQVHKEKPHGFQKLKTRGLYSTFTGFYSFLTYIGMLSDQLENVVSMGLRHLNNADSMTHIVSKEELPENLQETIENAYSKPSFFQTLLKPVAKTLGFMKSKGPDQEEDSHPGFDGLISFYSRSIQKATGWFFKLLGLKVPFNVPSDIDEDLAIPGYMIDGKPAKPGAPGKPGSEFDFINYQDMSLGKDGKPKNPRGHIAQWTAKVNPNPEINKFRLEEMKDLNIFGKLNNLWLMLNHPTTTRQALSFNFGMRNIVEVLLHSFKDLKNTGLLGALLSVPRLATTAVGTLFQPTGSFMAWIFGVTGNKTLISASSLWALVGSIHVMTGHALENLIKFISSWRTSAKENTSLSSELKKRGMKWTTIINALTAGPTALLAVPGFMARQLHVFKETKFFLVPAMREFFSVMHDAFSKIGLADSNNRKTWGNSGAKFMTDLTSILKNYVVPTADSIANLGPIRFILKRFLPVVTDAKTGIERIPFDVYHNILNDIINTEKEGYQAAQAKDKYKYFVGAPTVDPNAMSIEKEREDEKNTMFGGAIHKSGFLMYLYKLLVPYQGWAVVFSHAAEKMLDKDIQEHGNGLLKWADRIIGTINMFVAMPNTLIYGLTARAPQMMAAIYEVAQRFADAGGWKTKEKIKGSEKVVERNYDVMKDMVYKHRDWLLNSSFPLFRFLGKQMDQDIVHNQHGEEVFKDQAASDDHYLNFTENLCFDQEYSTEIPAAIIFMRDAMKSLINNFSFFRARTVR